MSNGLSNALDRGYRDWTYGDPLHKLDLSALDAIIEAATEHERCIAIPPAPLTYFGDSNEDIDTAVWVCWRTSAFDPQQVCRHDRCGWATIRSVER